MMKEEFLRELRAIPGHEDDVIMLNDYALVERVYTWHPSIPNVGGKAAIAHIYAYGGILVIKDMLPRAERAEQADAQIRAIRKDIQGMEQAIRDIQAEIYA